MSSIQAVRPRTLGRLCSPLILLSLVGLGCEATEFSTTVGPDGLDLELPGGAGLNIPAGALSEDVEIGVRLLSDLDEGDWSSPEGVIGAAPHFGIELTPHGLEFATPATLSLPYAEGAVDHVLLRANTADDGSWDGIGPIAIEDGLLSVPLSGFSAYATAEANCPCWNLSEVLEWKRTNPGGTLSLVEPIPYWEFDENQGIWVQQNPGLKTCRADGQARGLVDHRAYWGVPPANLTDPQQAGCSALLQATVPTGPASFLAATGLGTSERLTVGVRVRPGADVQTITLDSAASTPGPRLVTGQAYEFTVVTQPLNGRCTPDAAATGTAGAVADSVKVAFRCAPAEEVCNGLDDDGDGTVDEDFDADGDGVTRCGPDGTSGTADDDCDDDDANRYPGLAEACDGVDNDCDGNVDAGETTDGDADGVPDACDASPAQGCEAFVLDDAVQLKALTGAQCLVEASGAALPVPIADFYLAEGTEFTGVFVDHGAGVWEAVGVWPDAEGGFHAHIDCNDSGGEPGDCTGMGREEGFRQDLTADEYAACKGVAAYACR